MPDSERWGISNNLRVDRSAYATQDWAVSSVAMTRTKELLANFNTAFQSAGAITPTLLYAQETAYRAIGLDDVRTGGQYVRLGNGQLAIDLAPPAAPALAPDVVHSLKWSSFCAQPGSAANGSPLWAECAQDEYGYELVDRYWQKLAQPGDTEAMIDGRMIMMRLYYLSLWNGSNNVIRANGQRLVTITPPTDLALRQELTEDLVDKTKSLAEKVATKIVKKYFFNTERTLKTIGESRFSVMAKSKAFSTASRQGATRNLNKIPYGSSDRVFSSVKPVGKARIAAAKTVLAVTKVVFGVLAATVWKDNQDVQTAHAITSLASNVIGGVKTVTQVAAWAKIAGWSKVLRGNASFTGATARGAAVGAIIAIAVAWGIFLGTMLDSGKSYGDPEFNAGLAAVIAMTIYIVFLAVLSATVVGLLLVALLELVDAILMVICAVNKDIKEDIGKDGDCTIGGRIVTALTGYLYARDMLVEVDAEKNPDLVQQGAPIVALRTPGLGYIASNLITFTVPVTTNIVHKDPDNWNVIPYISAYFNEPGRCAAPPSATRSHCRRRPSP